MQSRISKLRHNPSQLPEAEWETILASSLLRRRHQEQRAEVCSQEKLELIAKVTDDSLTITFRKNISGITHRLGEIGFKKDEMEEIDSVSWAAMAVVESNELEDEIRDLTFRYNEQNETIKALSKQLDDLVEAKKQHEHALLEKFRDLLNAKKLKIRDQQRLLAGAKVDPKQIADIAVARSTSKSHTPAASRTSKRKAKDTVSVSPSEEDSFERKAATQKEEEELSEQVNTPDVTDQDVTEDEEDEDRHSGPQSSVPGTDKLRRESQGARTNGKPMQLEAPPPTREMPFANSGNITTKEGPRNPTADQMDDNDDETDDDEEL